MINYKQMSLFDAPAGSILVHACNAQGTWGKGIAAEFKKRFPKSYKQYRTACKNNTKLAGHCLLLDEENGYRVACLITSRGYKKPDSEYDILFNTVMALKEFCTLWQMGTIIYANKFNSGLFNVSWEKTEQKLKFFVRVYDLPVVICT